MIQIKNNKIVLKGDKYELLTDWMILTASLRGVLKEIWKKNLEDIITVVTNGTVHGVDIAEEIEQEE